MGGVLRRFLHDQRGVAVVEFALLGPTLALMLLAAVDLGRVLSERATLGHVLRAGAQMAMADAGAAAALSAMEGAASTRFSLIAGRADSISLQATRICACPNSPATTTACTTICTGSQPTLAFYRLGATKTYRGILYPRFELTPVLQVQVR